MATAAVDEDEDVLTCTVCLDSYTDPCSLDCKHTFCRRCLTDYVKTQANALQSKTIPCPSCPHLTRVPDPSRPVDEWAGQMQPGHVVQELMARGNKETTMNETPCYQCEHLGEITPGKSWCAECEVVFCQRCAKSHSLISLSSDHDLCDLKDQGQVSRRKSTCRVHRHMLIDLFCKNCNASHCQLCFVDHHKNCENVVTLKSFVSKMKTELSDLNDQVKESVKKSNSVVEYQKTRITRLNTDKLFVLDEIRCASQKVVDLIKQEERKLIDQVEDMANRESNELKAKVKLGNIQMQTYRQYSEYIKQAVSSDSEVEVCDAYQAWKSRQLEVTQNKRSENICSVRFHKAEEQITKYISTVRLGDYIALQSMCDPRTPPVLSESIDTRVTQDEQDPCITDITVLEVAGVCITVVTDMDNKCVKSFFTRNNKICHSRLQLDGSPKGIANLGDNKVIVFHEYGLYMQVVTVSVIPELAKVTHFNADKQYISLAVMSPSRLAAGAYECVDILNMQGEVIRSVTKHNQKKLFIYPRYMCVNNTGHLLVSDSEMKTVTCLTPEGEVAWIYSGTEEGLLGELEGITTNRGGDIFVVDSELEKVVQLSDSGHYVQDVVTSRDGWIKAMDICIDRHGLLFVCDKSKVFKFVF